MQIKNLKLDDYKPKDSCTDKNCPFHGELKVKDYGFEGVIISAKMQKSAIVEWLRKYHVKKYQRDEKRRTRIVAHNPTCVNAKEGDKVMIVRCRPLGKTKNFVIVKNYGAVKGFEVEMAGREEAKFKDRVKEDNAEQEDEKEEKPAKEVKKAAEKKEKSTEKKAPKKEKKEEAKPVEEAGEADAVEEAEDMEAEDASS